MKLIRIFHDWQTKLLYLLFLTSEYMYSDVKNNNYEHNFLHDCETFIGTLCT